MGISIATLPEGIFVDVNDAVLEDEGSGRSGVHSARSAAELDTWADPQGPGILPAGISRSGFIKNFETQLKVGSGSSRTSCYLSETIELYGNPAGFNFLLDVTRASSGEPGQDAYQFNDQVLHSAQEGIIVYDREFHYKVWNPFMEQLTGLPAGAVLGKHPLEVFPFMKVNGIMERLEQALGGETCQSLDFPYYIPSTGKPDQPCRSAPPAGTPKAKSPG